MEKSAAPYSVRNSFGLELFLHTWIDEWSDFRRGADNVSRLYLMLDCSEVEAFNIGKLYDSLYRIHPRLPVSFYQRCGVPLGELTVVEILAVLQARQHWTPKDCGITH